MAIIDTLSLKFEAEASKALSSINELERSLKSLSDIIGTLGSKKINFGVTATTITNIRNLASAIRELPLDQLKELSSITQEIKSFRIGVGEKTATNIVAFGDAVKTLDINKLKELAAISFENLKSLGIASVRIQGLSAELSRLRGASKGVKSVRSETEKLSKALEKTTEGTRRTNREAKKSNGILASLGKKIGGLFKSIGRIAFYRAIRSMIKEFTQGLSEGMKNLYYWSQAWGTSFHKSMDQLATSTLYLKNSFAAMFSPLIEKAIPIIDALIDKFVDFFNFVQEGFAQLTGSPTWNRAKKVADTWQDELDDASKSAKELKNQLMGFDELNVLNTPSASRGNSNKDEKDYSSMFELVETAAGDNFESIGEKLADALNKVFEDPDAWGEKGKGLATAITDGFNEGLDFFNGVDWVKVGESVSAFIREFNGKIADWIKNEEPLSKAIDAVTNAVCGVIEGIDVIELLKSFAKVFLSLSASLPSVILVALASAIKVIGTLLKKVGLKTSGAAALTVADKITEVRKKYDAWNSEKLGIVFDVMDNGFENYIPKDLEESESSGAKLIIDVEPEFEGKPNTLTGIQKAFNGFFQGLKTIFLVPIAIRLVQKLKEIDWEEVKKKLRQKALVITIKLINITKVLASAWQTIKEKWGEKKVIIKANFVNITKALSEGWEKIKEKWGEKFVPFKAKIDEAKKAAGDAWTTIQNVWGNPELSFTAKLDYSFQLMKSSLATMWDELKKLWGEKKLSVKAMFENIKLPHFKITDQSGGSNYTWNLTRWVSDKNSIPMLAIDWYAQGGFINPSSYSLAGLGENGVPEILGTVGGRSAVAGGAEITGIRDAIYEQGQREENLLRNLISAVNSKDLTLVANSSTGRWVNRALNAYAGVTG